MPRPNKTRLLETTGIRKRYRWSDRVAYKSQLPNFLYQFPGPMLAYVVFGFTVHVIMGFGIKQSGESYVPWLETTCWGLNLVDLMLFINALFLLNIVIDAFHRWRQNRANWIWQGVGLLIAFNIFMVFHIVFNEIDKTAQHHLPNCESVMDFSVDAKLPTLEEVRPWDRWHSDDRELRRGAYPSGIDVRVGLNAISINNHLLEIGVKNGKLAKEYLKDGTIPEVDRALSQIVQVMRHKHPSDMKEFFEPTLNFSADSRLPYGTLKLLLRTVAKLGFHRNTISIRQGYCKNALLPLPPFAEYEATKQWKANTEERIAENAQENKELEPSRTVIRVSLFENGDVHIQRPLIKSGKMNYRSTLRNLGRRIEYEQSLIKHSPEIRFLIVEYEIRDAVTISDMLKLFYFITNRDEWSVYPPWYFALIDNPKELKGAHNE